MSDDQTKKEIGYQGEEIARKYLIHLGYEILTSNYYSPYGEIDIIAKDANYLVFIEVKFRKDKDLDKTIQCISKSKQKKIIQTALQYIATHEEAETLYTRFDAILIFNENQDNHFDIRHYKDAFYGEADY